MIIDEIRKKQIKELKQIPGIGVSIYLKNEDPQQLYDQSNNYAGIIQDRCLLYVFRCAVYYATETGHEKEKLLWWNWKEK